MPQLTTTYNANLSIYFPFRIKSDLPSFVVADDLDVQRMDDQSKEKLLHIRNAIYDDEGRIKEFTGLPGCLFSPPYGTSLDDDAEFCSSNYMLRASSVERAREFNLALKLCGQSTSSLYIGYSQDGAAHFISPPCYFGTSALVLTDTLAKAISELQGQIARLGEDRKVAVLCEKYTYAICSGIKAESRFIELAIVLEMMLLPQSSQELSYRFSLRLAKLMSKLFQVKIEDGYDNAKRIYRTRSNLVHSGVDKELNQILPIALDYTRRLMCAYLENKDLFSEASLDRLCLS